MNQGSRRKSRELAVQVLFQKDFSETLSVDQALDHYFENFDSHQDIREYAKTLISGVFKNLKTIDEQLESSSTNWKIDRISFVDKNILRVGAYELLYRSEDVPPSVAINEAVEIAKKFSSLESSKFINGILDKISKTRHP